MDILYLILILIGFTVQLVSAKRDPYWKAWRPGRIPECAVRGGLFRFVGRVNTIHGQITAMIGSKKHIAVAIVQKKETFTRGVEILCAKNPKGFHWEPVDFKNPPDNLLEGAVKAGYQKDIRSDLYVGRAKHPTRYKVGKVIPPEKQGAGLWIWDSDAPLQVSEFEILKVNATK